MSRHMERLSTDQLNQSFRSLPGWRLVNGKIERQYRTDGWRVSMLVANGIAYLCEAANHHADVLVTWPSVTVTLWTHDAGGVTSLDVELAQMIEAHLSWKPAPGSGLPGQPEPLAR